MADKWIKIPDVIELRDLITRQPIGEKYPFFTWLTTIVLMDLRFSIDWKTNRSAMNISDAFFNKNANEWARISDNDYDLLKAATEEPQRYDAALKQTVKGYASPALFQQVGLYITAIQEAVSTDPTLK
jgi:hypothetical protein